MHKYILKNNYMYIKGRFVDPSAQSEGKLTNDKMLELQVLGIYWKGGGGFKRI